MWSDQNIVVQGLSTTYSSSDAFHVPDVSRLGTNYIAVTHRDYITVIPAEYQVRNFNVKSCQTISYMLLADNQSHLLY